MKLVVKDVILCGVTENTDTSQGVCRCHTRGIVCRKTPAAQEEILVHHFVQCFCDVVESVGGMTPVQVNELVSKLTNGQMADVTINCVNVPDQEMTAVLCTKDDGVVYFFSMATSFTKAALGAEGIGSDVNMIIGNGYTRGHAEFTLQELRECEALRKVFTELYA